MAHEPPIIVQRAGAIGPNFPIHNPPACPRKVSLRSRCVEECRVDDEQRAVSVAEGSLQTRIWIPSRRSREKEKHEHHSLSLYLDLVFFDACSAGSTSRWISIRLVLCFDDFVTSSFRRRAVYLIKRRFRWTLDAMESKMPGSLEANVRTYWHRVCHCHCPYLPFCENIHPIILALLGTTR